MQQFKNKFIVAVPLIFGCLLMHTKQWDIPEKIDEFNTSKDRKGVFYDKTSFYYLDLFLTVLD